MVTQQPINKSREYREALRSPTGKAEKTPTQYDKQYRTIPIKERRAEYQRLKESAKTKPTIENSSRLIGIEMSMNLPVKGVARLKYAKPSERYRYELKQNYERENPQRNTKATYYHSTHSTERTTSARGRTSNSIEAYGIRGSTQFQTQTLTQSFSDIQGAVAPPSKSELRYTSTNLIGGVMGQNIAGAQQAQSRADSTRPRNLLESSLKSSRDYSPEEKGYIYTSYNPAHV